jgi:ABC-2 type transport system ATP-binding protein
MDAKAVIEFRGVSKRFVYWQDRPRDLKKVLSNLFTKNMFGKIKNEWTVLSDVSFKISEGEFVGIMGRNGAGKSTLLKMISKIYYPTEGEIFLAGKIAPVLELGAGFADELSGLENIYLNAAILGFGAKRTEQLVDQIISFSELGEQVMQPVRNYSSGMLVRLGFSIACHLDAPILLFDEVLAVGDMGFQKNFMANI